MRAFIGLGGNLGEPGAAFRSVAAELRGIGPVRASSLYTSKPRDRGNQPAFTNAAVELETELEPADLLAMLKRLELTLGRDPAGKRWGPRVIDLDILAFDGRCFADPDVDLIVPPAPSGAPLRAWGEADLSPATIARKVNARRQHGDEVGRDPSDVTPTLALMPGPAESADRGIARLTEYRVIGVRGVIVGLPGPYDLSLLKRPAREIRPRPQEGGGP